MKKIKWSSGANKDLDRLRFYCEVFFGNLWDTRQQPEKLANYIDHIVQTEPTILNEPSIPYIKTDK